MVEHWFYHLEQSSIEQILSDLLEKTYAKNWRALVKVGPCLGARDAELARLDGFLWTYKQAGFLPHGRDDQPMADKHPICLTSSRSSAEGYDIVMLIGGAVMDDVGSAQRCITILDGANEQDKQTARARWKLAKDAGLKTSYWRQDDYGKWVQPKL